MKAIIHKTLGISFPIVLIFSVLAGCVSTPAPEGTQPPLVAQSTAVATQELPTEEASITIVIPEDPPSFNAIVGDTGYDGLVMNLVMLGLTGVDELGSVYPELAAKLPVIGNGGVVVDEEAGTMDVTWELRQDVTWADGQPVTAEDVVFTWEAIMNPETGIWVRGSDYVESVEKIDTYSVVFHYNSIYPGYLTQLGGEQLVVWPAHYCAASQGFVAWDCARQPLSNGPFLLDEWIVGDHMTFSRNPNYFEAEKPYLEKIIVRIVPDEAVRKAMMLQGDADLYVWATESVLKEMEDKPQVKISMAPFSRWIMRLFPNQAAKGTTDPVASPHPIFSDVRVRKAIRMAIDVNTISKELFLGYGEPVWTEFSRPPYECNIPRPVFDPEAAKALLEEAGWKDTDGDGIRECHGCQSANEGDLMKVEFYTYSEFGEILELTHQLIGEMLNNIGMDTQLSVFEGSLLWADVESGGIEQNGDFDLDLWDDGYSGIDPTDFLWELYHSSTATPGTGWNIVRWINPEFDALLEEAYTLDENRREEIFCEIATILDEEVPIILLFSAVNAEVYSARLEGVQSTVNDLVSWNAADWKIVK